MFDKKAQQRLTRFGHVSKFGSERLPAEVMRYSVIAM